MSRSKGKIRFGVGLTAVLMIASVVTSLFVLPTRNALAASDENTIWRKTLANAIQACYQDGIIKDNVNAQNFDITSAFKNRGQIVTLDSTSSNKFINCRQAFTKMNAFFGKSPSSPADLGYTLSEHADSEAQEKCLYLEYDMLSNGGMRSGFTTQQICFAVSGDETTGATPILSGEPTGGIYFLPASDGSEFQLHYDYLFQNASGMTEDFSNEYKIRFYPAKWADVLSSIQSRARELSDLPVYNNVKIIENQDVDNNARQDFVMNDLSAGAKAALKFYTGSDDFDQFKFTTDDIQFVQNRAFDAFKLDNAIVEFESCYPSKEGALEQGYSYARYNEAKNQWCPVEIINEYAQQPLVVSNLTSLDLYTPEVLLGFITNRNLGTATKVEVCVQAAQDRWDEMQAAWNAELQKPEDERDQEYTSYLISSLILISDMLKNDGRGTWTEDDNGNISCLPKPTLDGGTDVADPNAAGDNDNLPPSDNNEEEPTESKNPCLSTAGQLGWVLCPALDLAASTTEFIYTYLVEGWLTVTADEVGEGTRAGWGMVRDFANIIFVVALVVVVLSQVTGIGLSNYGIKKMLPTLIMVAVLVNISFILCQLAVDLSNIVGAGIKDLFVDASGVIGVKSGFGDIMTTLVGGAAMGTFTTAVVAGGILWGWTNPGSILPALFLVLITCLFSVIFFFLVLAIRKAGIIILIVLAPVAIVCYALPNTKKFFDKWKRMFVSLLVLYPICGLLMGGGQFVSALLRSNDVNGIFYNLVAMLIQVVPFFFIPSLLRSSLQAMGNIGAKVSGFGQRLGHGLSKRVGGSETFKDLQTKARFGDVERQKNMANRLKNNRFLGRAATWASNTRAGQALSAAQTRANARAIMAYRKRDLDNQQSDFIAKHTNEASIQAEKDAMELKQQQTLIDNATSTAIAGGASYEDASGHTVKIDPNNIDGTRAALEHFMDQYDASGGKDEDALIQAQAMMQLLMDRGGDKGQTAVTDVLKRRSDDGSGNGKRTEAAAGLSRFASRNGKWMSTLKSTDRGAFGLIGDLAQSGKSIQSRAQYAMAGTKSINPTQIPGLSDGFFDSWDKEINNGTFADNPSTREDLLRLDDTFQQAVRDPRVAQSLKPETLDRMNKIHEEAQKYRYDDWAKNEWAKDEWRKDQYVHDQIAENAWRNANGKAANYTLTNDEKTAAQQDYANAQWRAENGKAASYQLSSAEQRAALSNFGSKVLSSDAAQAASMRGSMTAAQTSAALSGYQDMTGAQINDAKTRFKNSMNAAQVQAAQAQHTLDDFTSKFGNNTKLEVGREVKVPRRLAQMPNGWMRNGAGAWVDMSPTGAGRQLTIQEQRRAEAIEQQNINADIENEVNGL